MTKRHHQGDRRAHQLQIIAIVVAIVVPILLWAAGTYSDRDDDGTSTTSPSTDSAVESSSASQEEIANIASAAPEIGSCLSSDIEPLPCDSSHTREVFAKSSDCSPQALISYLGGIQHRDVLRADLSISDEQPGLCVVELPSDTSVSRSLEGILAQELSSEKSPWLRRCFDGRSEQDVHCGLYHTAEYVWEIQRSSMDPVDCVSRASEYLSTSVGELYRKLEVEDLSSSDMGLCRVSAKSSNSLEGSLRDLGKRQVPLAPR
jgi:hypothetical protein